MFRLVTFFSIASLVAFAGLTFVLNDFYRREAVADLVRAGESKNVALTQAFANSLWPDFAPFVGSASRMTRDELRSDPEVEKLREAVLKQMSGLTVVKVKVYNPQGLTVFSTEPDEIGADEYADGGFQSAIRNVPASELAHKNTFSAFERQIVDRDLLSTYIPIHNGDTIEGVFEVYDDVTPLVMQINDSQRRLLIDVIGGLAVLYLVLLVIVARAEAVIRRQERDLVYSQAQLNAVLDTVGESIITVDPSGAIVMVNQEARQAWGYQDGDLAGRSMSMLLGDKDWDVVFGHIKRYLESGEMKGFGKRLRMEGVKRNGAAFPLEGRIVDTQVGEKMLLFTIALRDLSRRDEE